MFTTLKNWLRKLTGTAAPSETTPETLVHEAPVDEAPQPTLGERFALEAAPTPSEAEDEAIMGTEAQSITYDEAYSLGRAASKKYSVGAVHVDPATARVRVSDNGAEGPWFWAEAEDRRQS